LAQKLNLETALSNGNDHARLRASIGCGPGAETRALMARAIIGGTVLSTLVTLVLVPVF